MHRVGARLSSLIQLHYSQHLPKSNGHKYIIQGCCSLWHYIKFRQLCVETAVTLGEWMFEDILCRWGAISEIVTDNGPQFIKALEYLRKKYHIHHIRISGYNSQANRIVEWSHFDVQQTLCKVVDGVQLQWTANLQSLVHILFYLSILLKPLISSHRRQVLCQQLI